MGIIKTYQRKTDTTYVYTNEAYWDPEKKQSRSSRKLIGKIDKETGEIVPTGKRGRKKTGPADADSGKGAGKGDDERISALEGKVIEQKSEIIELRSQLESLRKENIKLRARTREAERQVDRNRRAEDFFRKFGSLAEMAKRDGLLDPP